MNKSKIRQTALNLIYAIEENGGDMSTFDLDLFWQLAQEKETDHYRQAMAKAIIHVCRASATSANLLESRSSAALEALQQDLTARPLHAGIERLQKRSAEFEEALAIMKSCLHDKRQDTTDKLERCCNDVFSLASAVEGLGQELLPTLADYPAYHSILEPLGAAIRKRGKLMAACAAISTPLDLENQNEFAGLANHARNLQELRPAVEPLALAVAGKKEELDARLTSLLHNYSIDRLDMVDKCILYLSLYELEVNKLDIPIVVSEANALADAYSSGKSAPFIHGILSSAARQDAPLQQA